MRQSARITVIDFDQARAAHLALREFFDCRAAANVVGDSECLRAIRSIEDYSALLSSAA